MQAIKYSLPLKIGRFEICIKNTIIYFYLHWLRGCFSFYIQPLIQTTMSEYYRSIVSFTATLYKEHQ